MSRRTLIQQILPKEMAMEKECSILSKLKLSWLRSQAAAFKVNGNQVRVISEPSAFYDTLLKKCQAAKKRIVLASLYLGTGPLEAGLVSAIRSRIAENSELRVTFLLDCMRGSRGKTNSRTMLLPLLNHHSKSCQVNLYHTPKLRGFIRRYLPKRYNEIVGLQHMKLYLFDDDLIISGANLSEEYFTRRQDRYIEVANCRSLADFVDGLCSRISDFSFRLDGDDNLVMNPSWKFHPVESPLSEFIAHAREHVMDFYSKFLGSTSEEADSDTIILPLLEMGQLGIHQDSSTTRQLLEHCPADSKVRLATGYFNMTREYADSILKSSKAKFKLLMAHPKANGFYHAKGPAGGIPKGYNELSGKFFDRTLEENQSERVKLYEYLRDGWTFHAKGLWYTPVDSTLPYLTSVGSPNFGERSVNHDLECQFYIVTENESLRQALKRENDNLQQYLLPYTLVERNRGTPLWVHVVLYLFKSYF